MTALRAIRSPDHPILLPRKDDVHWWERNGIFNAGVTTYKDQIILLYRAYDDFRISRLGLANSQDGVHFERYDHPAIDTNPDDEFERIGIEDPRITNIDGTYYIVHTSASYKRVGEIGDVKGSLQNLPWRVRTGMHTTKDFKSFLHWGVILKDIPAKNGSLLPEKIDGAFGLYYRELVNDTDVLKISFTHDFQSWFNTKIITWPKAETWQEFKFGLGSQPIATPAGYLIVYHAVDINNVYRLGLMLFDRQDPAKIIWHQGPILEPEKPYEKKGFIRNVVYTCGAVIVNDTLWIYYGAADKVIGRAVVSMKDVEAAVAQKI